MTARLNRSSAKPNLQPGLQLNNGELEKGNSRYDDWHWGVGPSKVMDWDDPDYPRMLIECGRLVRMHVRAPDNWVANPKAHPRRKRDTMIELSRVASENSHIAFDPDHPEERLYLLVDSNVSKTLARRFWHENDSKPIELNALAAIAGGKHGKRADYPQIKVKPIGVLTAVVYRTHKKGDENPGDPRSFYIHAVGELSNHYPILSVDERGRLWLAGGNYTAPSPGITD
jgi:hypothetical protein